MNRATAMLPARGKFLHVGRLGGYYNLKYYRACDHLVANTEDIANYLKNNGWGEDQVHYLPNFVTAKRAPKIKRKELYTSNNATLLLALGRLHENKAFDVLLEAFAQVPNAYLWIAGEGPLRETLERKAERLGVRKRTRFLGWRQNVEALYATADILVCPSRHEPLGNVVIEGWAHGVPVVAADNLGPGALIKDGDTGLLFPVNDANALAAALKRLISNDELGRRLVENGKKIYKTKFSEKIVVDRYIKLFEQMSL
jgi:glycosyltransferase involved in cell wall biosynthesis